MRFGASFQRMEDSTLTHTASDPSDKTPAFVSDINEHSAATLFRDGKLHQAANAYRALTDRHPERLDFQARLGYLELISNNATGAVNRLTGVLAKGFRNRTILSHLGEAYCRIGDLGPAALCFQQLGREGLAGTLAAMADLEMLRLSDTFVSGQIPWIDDDPLPVIRVAINGEQANLIIDTGAGDCVLDTRFAISAGVRLGGQEGRHFAGGQHAQVTHGHAAQLDLTDIRINDVPVQVLDLQQVFADWYPGLAIHGVLGIRVLSLFHCTLDYQTKSLRLESPKLDESPSEGSPIWLAEDWMLLSQADFPSLRQALVFLDSGMVGGAFAVSESRASSLGIESDPQMSLVGTGGGGTVSGTAARVESIAMDSLIRTQVGGLLLDALSIETTLGYRINGLIGSDMFRGAHLSLDFANMRLRVSS